MQLVTVQILAEKLNVRESWIRSQLSQRKIPFIKLGRHVRFDEDAVKAWISLDCPRNWREIKALNHRLSRTMGAQS